MTTTTAPPIAPTLLRTAHDGCFQLITNAWGTFLAQATDPDANVEITDEQLKGFELRDDIARIPADLWQRWVQLAFTMTERDRRNLEVSCRLLRHEDDRSKWRILVPKQEVSGASVRVESFDHAVDITTGEIVSQYPPPGWIPCGSSHSHNTMSAFFSGTDDKFELGDPGLHIVIGSIDAVQRNYNLKASITANHRRFEIDHTAVIDATPVDVMYHPDALKAVSIEQPTFSTLTTSGTSAWLPKSRIKADPDNYWFDDPLLWGDTPRQPSPLNDHSQNLLRSIRSSLQTLSNQLTPELISELDELAWQINDVIRDFEYTQHPTL